MAKRDEGVSAQEPVSMGCGYTLMNSRCGSLRGSLPVTSVPAVDVYSTCSFGGCIAFWCLQLPRCLRRLLAKL